VFHPHPPWFRLGILFIQNFSPFSHPPRETHRSFPCSGAIAREAAVVASRHGERPPLVRYIQKWPPMWPVRLLSASFHRFHSSLRHVFALAGVLPLAWNKREPLPSVRMEYERPPPVETKTKTIETYTKNMFLKVCWHAWRNLHTFFTALHPAFFRNNHFMCNIPSGGQSEDS
jgi:hypothetical protein